MLFLNIIIGMYSIIDIGNNIICIKVSQSVSALGKQCTNCDVIRHSNLQ